MNMPKSALMIVDVQLAPFIWAQYGGKELYQAEQLLRHIQSLIHTARLAGTPVIYMQYTEEGDSPRGLGQPLWQVHPEVAPQEGDITIAKYHADPFLGTELHMKLQELGITRLVITGVQTEFCVESTCRSAHSLGYANVLVTDGHSTFDSDNLTAQQIIEHHNTVLGSQFAELKRAEEVVF
ncbi:cysteine hydrolase family protein [Paenibacillus sp. YPG26]|uniref:cysteine hydrolase family protein n=1 Tax=Paenibacillus sp. YPG26 TaxID=2878915 RepID=UPI0020414E95|nr:cysteine hydrolase family protein [Paenibacillus sp. YPG26]USB33584.1 cysteine hydrolase [Paenibacillus sp. YPG26]